MQIIKFDAVSLMFNPFVLMFITITFGLLFGKIKFGKFSFGTSGALFVGLAVGWAVYGFAQKVYLAGFRSCQATAEKSSTPTSFRRR